MPSAEAALICSTFTSRKSVAAAANRLINLAKCQYIAPIASDDILMPDAIERMLRAMETESEDVILYGPYLRPRPAGIFPLIVPPIHHISFKFSPGPAHLARALSQE